jgi:ABC-2 type transport system ATP-binding protein
MSILEINGLVKTFNGLTALENVDLNIEKGEFFGLLGPNGAGKSTLMNCVIGYLNPEKGVIKLKNSTIAVNNMSFRHDIGYVPQEISLYEELTAIQNLTIFGGFYGLSRKELDKRIKLVLELVQLTDRRTDHVKNFSGGMKRRLNLAASIIHDPEILLCDEPTVGVDPQSRNAIFDMLAKLHKEGKTILYTTHYMEEAERLCSRLAIIDYGKIIAEGTLSDLISLLEKKETIKVRKSKESVELLNYIKKLGDLNETDFYYEIIPHNSSTANSALFKELENISLPSHLIELSTASLEDVFLSLTGRRLRD